MEKLTPLTGLTPYPHSLSMCMIEWTLGVKGVKGVNNLKEALPRCNYLISNKGKLNKNKRFIYPLSLE